MGPAHKIKKKKKSNINLISDHFYLFIYVYVWPSGTKAMWTTSMSILYRALHVAHIVCMTNKQSQHHLGYSQQL